MSDETARGSFNQRKKVHEQSRDPAMTRNRQTGLWGRQLHKRMFQLVIYQRHSLSHTDTHPAGQKQNGAEKSIQCLRATSYAPKTVQNNIENRSRF